MNLNQAMINLELLNKYNIPVPRYTSYPTVPYWTDHIDSGKWAETFSSRFREANRDQGISLYLHLPFCESLCTYCGCNKKITTNHKVEPEYISALKKEWELYKELMDEKPVIREIHLGGGTPTFFSPQNLQQLLKDILDECIIPQDPNFSLEGHPNNTTREHLESLYDIGFRRISYGVQDNNPRVQRVINRIQPFEQVRRATAMARETGYDSVNFDLIYGLPLQTPESIAETVEQCITLYPDRVAFYSYAHVPWTSRGQRLFDEQDLPTASQKMELYLTGKKLFLQNRYQDIGMDHFALPDDALYVAANNGTLHRNFMGYTTQFTSLMLGLGVSSISDSSNAFAQNSKSIHDYYAHLKNGELPIEKGYFLSAEDQVFRKHILDISCRGRTEFQPGYLDPIREFTIPELEKLSGDGLVEFDEVQVQVTARGRHFIRNICRAFDLHLLRKQVPQPALSFSKAI